MPPRRSPDNARASGRGPTYHAIFALCYGLGLRAGEACGLRIGDVDNRRQLLVVRGGKFGKSRLVPHGPRIGELLARQVERRGGSDDDPLFSFDGRRSVHPGTASQVFHRLVATLGVPGPRRCLPAACFTASATPSRSAACCAGIGRGSTPRAGSTGSRRSWATSTPSRPPST